MFWNPSETPGLVLDSRCLISDCLLFFFIFTISFFFDQHLLHHGVIVNRKYQQFNKHHESNEKLNKHHESNEKLNKHHESNEKLNKHHESNEKRKILHCRNRSKFQWKIVERGKIDTIKTQIQMYTSAHFPGLVEALQ